MTDTLREPGSDEPAGYGQEQDSQQEDEQPGQQPVEALLTQYQRHDRRVQVHGRTVGQHPVQQSRQLRQQRAPLRRLIADVAQQAAPAHLLGHPALQIGFGGGPQVEIRVEVPTEAFDIQQRFLQQDQLRLDLDVEAPRSLEQAQQDFAERDFPERPVENRFANGANGRFEFFDTGFGGDLPRIPI